MMKRRKYMKSYRDFANIYVKENDDLTAAQYREIMKSFAKKLATAMIEEGYCYKMPGGLGRLLISGHKKSLDGAPIDWKETHKRGKIIRYLNLHSDRYIFKFRWLPDALWNFLNRKFYVFKPTRAVKSELSKYIKDCAKDPYKKNYRPVYESPNYYY